MSATINVSDAVHVEHERAKKAAQEMTALWRYITIDAEGNVKKGPIQTQEDVFNMFPEIRPNFFGNFGIKELTIRQANGTQLKLIQVRS